GVSVQSFCSTSLAAVHLACQSLLNFECDLAVAGGIALNSLQKKGYFHEEGLLNSPDSYCRPFDARAQGSVLSNGAAVVALKRFQEALDDGDQRVSYTAPGLEGQASVIASAMSYAGVHPETIAYIEANGSSTMLGDAIELAAMSRAFAAKTRKKQFCGIGSLKSNVGHLDRASGVAGLIKTALALSHRQLPPHIHYEQPNPEIDLGNSPFYINTNLTPWPRLQTPRRAAINSFGLGGTNVHLVLEEAPEREAGSPSRDWQVLPLSAKSAWSLQQASSNLAAHLRAHPEQSLADVAYTLQVGRCAFSYRQFVVAQTAEEACAALEQKQTLVSHQECRDRAVAFLFSDMGKRSIDVARNLYGQEPHFRETLDRCCQFLQTHLKLDLQPLLSPEPATDGTSEVTCNTLLERWQTNNRANGEQIDVMQPVTFIVAYALARLLMEWHIRPQAMLGYGPGEYVAACLAGVLSLEDALILIAYRASLTATHGAVDQSVSRLLRSITWHEPQIPYISSVTGTWVTKKQATDPDYWAGQLYQPAQRAQEAERLLQESGRVLLAVTADCVSEQSAQIIPLFTQRFDQADLLSALGRLWLAGVTIDWRRLSAHERRLRVSLPTYPFERQRCWIDDPANLNIIRQRIAATTKEGDIADWFYLPYWEQKRPPVLPERSQQKQLDDPYLIFVDAYGIGTGIAQKLEQEGYATILVEVGEEFAQQSANRFTLRADSSEDYAELFKALSSSGCMPKTIMHCWNVTTDEVAPVHSADFNAQQKIGFASLLCLAQAIGTSLHDAPLRLIVVSNYVQAVTGQELLCPEKAAILGIRKV